MAKPLKKNPVTLEEIAILMRQGFTGMDEKLGATEAKVKALDGQFDEVHGEMGYRFDAIERQLDRLEKIMHDEYRGWIVRLEERIKALEADFRTLLGGKK